MSQSQHSTPIHAEAGDEADAVLNTGIEATRWSRKPSHMKAELNIQESSNTSSASGASLGQVSAILDLVPGFRRWSEWGIGNPTAAQRMMNAAAIAEPGRVLADQRLSTCASPETWQGGCVSLKEDMVVGTLTRSVLLTIAVTLFLSGCDSPEERAEEHFQNGLALVQEGKLAQAGIEFRNALRENGAHQSARLEFARMLEQSDDRRGAIGQYLAVVQQDDKNGPAHLALARLAVASGDFQSASGYVRRAFELLPEDPEARALMASVEFREGDKDAGTKMAQEVLANAPDSIVARLVVVADRMHAKDFATALQSADAGLALAPDSADLHLARLASLESEGDVEAVGRQLQEMVERFPDNEGFRRALLQWYFDQNDPEAAVSLMREIAERTPEEPAGYLNVAQLILQTSGPEAARQELQRLVDTQEKPAPFIQALAQLDFEIGNRDAAIASLRTLAQGDDKSPEKRDLQITLATMLLQQGAQDEANALINAVLEQDDRHVEALKLRAWRLIGNDAPEEALRDLGIANQEKPEDPEIFTIMAAAHQREGAHELAGQRLAQAVQASGFGREESSRYARFLLGDERYSDAEGVLLDALGRAANDLDLLALLGQAYLQREDWTRARQTAETMARLDSERARAMARTIELSALRGQGKTDEVVNELRDAAAQAGDDIRPRLAVVETLATAGNLGSHKGVIPPVYSCVRHPIG